jgi:hypothetical protein
MYMMVLFAMLLELASKQTMTLVYGVIAIVLLVLLLIRRRARKAKN